MFHFWGKGTKRLACTKINVTYAKFYVTWPSPWPSPLIIITQVGKKLKLQKGSAGYRHSCTG